MYIYNTQGIIEHFTELKCKPSDDFDFKCTSIGEYYTGHYSYPMASCVKMESIPYHTLGSGNDIMRTQAPLEKCKKICTTMNDCQAIAWNNEDCILKSKPNLKYHPDYIAFVKSK